MHIVIDYALVSNFTVEDLVTNYTSPYLLDFQFTLMRPDPLDVTAEIPLIVPPRLLSITCFEDGRAISTNEGATILDQGNSKLFKTHLVLDFTESIATLQNGDTNNDGISDAVDAMVAGAQSFVDQQRGGAQVGVYEYHRDDRDPQKVASLTTDQATLDAKIAGIWTNYVQGFPAGSRGWDALIAAITDLGPTNSDEQHSIVFVSDGKDESSFATLDAVVAAASAANVKIFCIGFGAELDASALQFITFKTGGRYYGAQAVGGIAAAFNQVGRNFSGQYLLRWATLKRGTTAFMPSFQITYQGFTADSPTNPYYMDTNNPIINTNATPPTTNYNLITNYIISPYKPSEHTGDVTVGSLRLVANASDSAQSVTLRATYIPRYIRQLRVHYRANWPCTAVLQSTNAGQILYGWSMSETNDGFGGKWLMLSSPNPQRLDTSIPFGTLGNLVTFYLRDIVTTSNAFNIFNVDNSIYTNTGNQSFVLQPTSAFVTTYTVPPLGTPAPWLIAHGFPNNFAAAELSDPDNDGIPTWKEYLANTDPRNAASRFVITSFSPRVDGRYQVTFTTSTNRSYRVEFSTDLTTWEILADNITGINAPITFVDTRYLPGLTQRYYRVAVY